MPDQITTAFVRQFEDSFQLLSQQLVTDIESKVTVVTDIKDKKYIDYVGIAGEPKPQTSLVEKTELDEIPHSRRLVITLPFDRGVPVPKGALRRMKADPTNKYLQSLRGMWARFYEKIIFLAAIGNATSVATEDLTQTSIPLPDTQKYEETGTVGMTAAKIIRAATVFSENDLEDAEKFLSLAPQAIENLFLDPDVLYPQQQALQLVRTGKMVDLWGFKVMKSNKLPKTGNIRSNIAWCKQGIGLGLNTADDIFRIDERSDLKYVKQIYTEKDLGATRLQETNVFVLQAYESY